MMTAGLTLPSLQLVLSLESPTLVLRESVAGSREL